MVIKHTDYAEGVHEIELKATAESLKLSELFFGDAVLNIEMDKAPSQIVLKCELIVSAAFECDRCTKNYDEMFSIEFNIVYIIGEAESGEKDDDVHYITPEQDKLNLGEDIKDYAEISLPMKQLCDDDCKGLCTKCGVNLNEKDCNCKDEEVNPIWEPLLKLKNNLSNRE